MSKAGYSYDNAPTERYFNTLKNECINLHEYQTEEMLYRTVEEFAYVHYNHVLWTCYAPLDVHDFAAFFRIFQNTSTIHKIVIIQLLQMQR